MYERLLECLLLARRYGVSDIHISLQADGLCTIEMRIGNAIRRLKEKEGDDRFFHYLMYRANLDISDMFSPQTGSFEEKIGEEVISLRFAVLCSYRLTSGVLRILNTKNTLRIMSMSRMVVMDATVTKGWRLRLEKPSLIELKKVFTLTRRPPGYQDLCHPYGLP